MILVDRRARYCRCKVCGAVRRFTRQEAADDARFVAIRQAMQREHGDCDPGPDMPPSYMTTKERVWAKIREEMRMCGMSTEEKAFLAPYESSMAEFLGSRTVSTGGSSNSPSART